MLEFVAQQTQEKRVIAISEPSHKWLKREHERTNISMFALGNEAVQALKEKRQTEKREESK